jgi:hypothetical protein
LKLCDGRSQGGLGLNDRLLVLISLPRPEEASEAVFMPAGDDVDMEVRHALTHPIVDRHKTPLGAKRPFDRASQQLDIPKEWRDQCGRKIR